MCSAFNGKNILFLDFQSFFETGVFIWIYINVCQWKCIDENQIQRLKQRFIIHVMASDSQPKWMWFHEEQIIRPIFIYSKHFVFDFHWCMFIDRRFQEINFARVAARSRQNHDDHINYWYVGSSAHNKYVYHYNQKRVIHQSLFEIDNTIFYKSRVVQTQRIQWSSIQIIMQASNTEYHLLHEE